MAATRSRRCRRCRRPPGAGACAEDVPVVAYDGNGNLAAARAWWLLRWAGVPDVRLLDGALAAWVTAGGDLDVDDVVPEPGDIVLTGGELPTLDLDEVQQFSGVLLDARAGERYRGETEPIDPKAGHIPGATSAPTTENLTPDGRFLDADELRERFAALGVATDSDRRVLRLWRDRGARDRRARRRRL